MAREAGFARGDALGLLRLTDLVLTLAADFALLLGAGLDLGAAGAAPALDRTSRLFVFDFNDLRVDNPVLPESSLPHPVVLGYIPNSAFVPAPRRGARARCLGDHMRASGATEPGVGFRRIVLYRIECTMPDQPPSRSKKPDRANKAAPGGRRSPSGATGGPRQVQCAKLGRELPGLPGPPFQTHLGERIHASISQEAWGQWLQHSQMFINERELQLSDGGARKIWMEECERFLFGSDSAPPPGWVPPTGFVRLTRKNRSDSE